MIVMKFSKHVFTVFFMVIMLQCIAQDVQQTERGVKLALNTTTVELQFYNASTVRVLKYPAGKETDPKSLSVIATPVKVNVSLKRSAGTVTVSSGQVNVAVNLSDGQVSFLGQKSKTPLLKEKAGSTSFEPFNDAGVSSYAIKQAFELDPEEAIYGLGSQQRGKMIQRNLKMNMVQGNTDDYVPFFQSVKGYGLFWDNYSPTIFEDNTAATSFSSQVGDCVDYYFMYGGNADGVIAQMRSLTGQAPMFPLWTYGFWQSRERYKSQAELVDVVRKYRQLNVPLDGVIQDWQYWGNNYLWNAMDFLNVDFPDPKKMVEDVRRLNAHMIISIWSSFGPQTLQYKELEKINALFNFKTWPESGSEKWPPNPNYPSGVRVYDAYNPAARDIYWKYLKNMHSIGIDGWWMDSSEPDHFNATDADLNTKTFLGSFRRVRNAYPLMTVGGVYQNQRKVDNSKRVFILTRSAFAGQQRYGANTWSGDVVSSWDALHNQVIAGLNFSLTGIPHWNSDIGGFFLWNFRRKLDDPEYRELYTRWLEFGAFNPMMRSHGADAPREIYQFGKKGDKVYDAIEKFIRLRYTLLPYIYSTSYQVTANQSSMMRALMMDFPSDKNVLPISDQFMFGKSLLVCPVVKPMYVKKVIAGKDTTMAEDFSTVRTRDAYLPAGSKWFDFWTSEPNNGGQWVKKETPIDIIPVFVKAGSILPAGPSVQYATEKKWDELEIRVYPGADGEFVLYEDENDNYNYEKGVFSTITFRWDDKKKILTIADRAGAFPGMLSNRKFNVTLVQQQAGKTSNVNYAGKQVKVKL
ncbi:glycoside hydrolase family 31 protein [Terrimonas sp. NA20]|uniref:Glycoside hydrolase family 31 protein n=1 Tax=Terrimonas ginsenosidimutans TaxID=2908004 RepID=A0ABS9KVH4_9BACT|nr:TIM-barrel domain-containing protein [Terrimonas ginsenosidimutans]MCG2616323.1 glycoside hydrolase family 31 protein [Terrimonas ginsenosidimutans]